VALAERTPAAEARLQHCIDLVRAGRPAEAAAACRSLLVGKAKRMPRAWAVLAVAERDAGRPEAALRAAEKAARLAPGWDEAQRLRGGLLMRLGRCEAAVAALSQATDLAPGHAEGWSMLGSALKAAGRGGEAVAAQAQAADLAPRSAEIRFNLANALAAAERPAEAEAAFAAVLADMPNHWRARLNLAAAQKAQQRLVDARETLRAALAAAPDNAEIAYNLALVELQLGERGGWRRYDARLRLPGFALRRPDGPLWDGTPLAGRELLVVAEQGLGDTLQFCRYVPALQAAGAGRVTFAAQAPLVPLLRAAGLADRLVSLDEMPAGRLWCPLLSLPGHLPMPAAAPYLAADPQRRARWRARLAGRPGRRIGIAWQGNPDYADDARRSPPLAALAPLLETPNCSFVSLQKGPGAEQAAPFVGAGRLADWSAEMDVEGAFLDTAALIAELDLVVTSDTAVAHLAGALGAEVFLLLAHLPDWRWGCRDGLPQTTPGYANLRLRRQPAPGDWAALAGTVRRDLAGAR
jgi:tetratricopeptide (TPR) repeat protein